VQRDATSEIRVLVDDVLATGRALSVSGGDAYARGSDARERLDRRLQRLGDQLLLGEDEHGAAEQALTFLELDPYYFWSGFARARMTRQLSNAHLDETQRQRARQYVLDCVDGTKHCGSSEIAQLARSVADNSTRRALRSRLHELDTRIARRAVRAITKVRHPGMTDTDVARARQLVLGDATNTPWLAPNAERLARWLWTPDWEAELRDLTQHHGPTRAGAKKLIESMERRRALQARRRPGP
jgi:hypothetical protein